MLLLSTHHITHLIRRAELILFQSIGPVHNIFFFLGWQIVKTVKCVCVVFLFGTQWLLDNLYDRNKWWFFTGYIWLPQNKQWPNQLLGVSFPRNIINIYSIFSKWRNLSLYIGQHSTHMCASTIHIHAYNGNFDIIMQLSKAIFPICITHFYIVHMREWFQHRKLHLKQICNDVFIFVFGQSESFTLFFSVFLSEII